MKNQAQRFLRATTSGTLLMVAITVTGPLTPGQRRPATPSRTSTTLTQAQSSELKKALALGDFYYKNGDITDKAAVQYRKVRDSAPKSSEGATAQYYLGSYFHRKFYIQKEKKLKEDVGLLTEAKAEYEGYASKSAWNSPKPEWLSDAYFNLALILAQRGDSQQTEQYLGKMFGAAPYDQKVYIYQVVWSPSAKDVVDAYVDSRQLAQYANSLVYSSRQAQLKQSQPPSFDYFVERIRQWCVSQK